MKPNAPALLAALAATLLIAACGDRIDQPPPSNTVVVPVPAPSTPPATPAPAPVPPVSSQPAPDGATAKDSRANDPSGTLTREQESNSMPKAGQANNHSSPSFEKDKKS